MKRFLEFVNENKNTMRLYYSDKLRTLFTKISNSSSEEAGKIANFLLLAEDSNQIEDKYTLVDITDKNDYISYIQVNRILKEFPPEEGKIEYDWRKLPKDSKLWTDEKTRTKHKIGKWVTHIYKDVYKNTDFTPSQIEEFSNVYKANYDKKDNEPEFIILKGDNIKWGYLENNYAEGTGDLLNSCMRYSRCQNYFDIYTENEDVCSLLVLKDYDNKVKGRALLWVLADGDKYMDRIYSNNSDKHLFIEWAKENNYRIYSNDYGNKIVNVGEKSYDRYPYMDTFVSFNTEDGYLSSSEERTQEFIKLQDTHGGYSESGVWSDYQGEYIDEDYAIWIDSISDYVHQDDSAYLEYKDTYEINDANYRRRNDLPAIYWSECEETYLYEEDSSYSETLKDYVNISDGDYVTFIINKDGDTDIVPGSIKYSHLYKEVDGENYSMDYLENPYTGDYGFWDDIIYDVRNELVKELGEDSTKVKAELVEKLLEFEPNEEFLKYIKENSLYNRILRTYYGYSIDKPTPIEMLPVIYIGTLIKIEKVNEYWVDGKFTNKLDYILNLIGNEELTNKYKIWTKSNSMFRNLLQFVYGFDYSIFDEDIYKRILYNRIFF